jgi:ankyrin repeat protein
VSEAPNPSALIAIHRAFVAGDLMALRAALGDPPEFPNCGLPAGFSGPCLEYAIYHAPIALVRTLLTLGAEPNAPDPVGFPSLIAALSADREDRLAVVELLLSHGADLGQRGINDWTPLHWAAAGDDVPAVQLLLARGADPAARTRIDDCATPLEEAEVLGKTRAAEVLRRHAAG